MVSGSAVFRVRIYLTKHGCPAGNGDSVKNKLDSLFFTRKLVCVGYIVPERHK